MTQTTDQVILTTTNTKARWFGGTWMSEGEQLPTQGPLPRWFAEKVAENVGPYFIVEITSCTELCYHCELVGSDNPGPAERQARWCDENGVLCDEIVWVCCECLSQGGKGGPGYVAVE